MGILQTEGLQFCSSLRNLYNIPVDKIMFFKVMAQFNLLHSYFILLGVHIECLYVFLLVFKCQKHQQLARRNFGSAHLTNSVGLTKILNNPDDIFKAISLWTRHLKSLTESRHYSLLTWMFACSHSKDAIKLYYGKCIMQCFWTLLWIKNLHISASAARPPTLWQHWSTPLLDFGQFTHHGEYDNNS